MQENIAVAVLLLAYITPSGTITPSTITPSGTTATVSSKTSAGHRIPTMIAEDAVTVDPHISPGLPVPRQKQLVHMFSEPVTIAIILGVIAVIVGVILSFAFCVQLLTRKSSVDKPPFSEDKEEPLNSVEVEHTEE